VHAPHAEPQRSTAWAASPLWSLTRTAPTRRLRDTGYLRHRTGLAAPVAALMVAACASGCGVFSDASTPPASVLALSAPVPQGGTMTLEASASVISAWDGQSADQRLGQVEYLTENCLIDPAPIQQPGSEQFVPGLAADLPIIGDGGKLYTFRIRKHLRYADGTTVRPEDIKAFFQRILDPAMGTGGALASGYFDDIVGMRAYAPPGASRAHAKTIRGIEVHGSGVTFRLTRPDPDFLAKLSLRFACPQKPGGPHTRSTLPMPSTGPYRITQLTPNRLVLDRNPYWWSNNAAILGLDRYRGRLWNFDRFVFTWGLDPHRVATDVAAGTADGAWLGMAPAADAATTTTPGVGASRLMHAEPASSVAAYAFNTHGAFANPKLRLAANYAIDRAALSGIAGDGTPWDAILPQALLPATRPGTLFGLRSRPSIARRLVDASGLARPIRITLAPDPQPPGPAVAAAVAAQLDRVGFHVLVVSAPSQQGASRLVPGAGPVADLTVDDAPLAWFDAPAGMAALAASAAPAPHAPPPSAAGVPANLLTQFLQADAMPYGAARTVAFEAVARAYALREAPSLVWRQDVYHSFLSERIGGFAYDPVHLVNLAHLYRLR
jgi:ABC-type transport system substrate-binding protein